MSLPAARSGLISAGVLLALNAVAAEPEVSLTVYSSAQPGGIPAEWYRPLPGMGTPQANQLPGFALVRLDRELQIPRGRGTIQFTDVAALIDPTTVQFLSLSDPEGTKVLEQNFQFDLVSQEKLLSRYIDRQVSVEQQSGDGIKVVDGTLVSSNDGLVIRGADGQIHALREWSNMRFGELPGGLITRPTLEWDVVSAQGRHAGGARLLPDGRHHLVGRLQPDLHRGRGREFRLRGRRRLGEPAEPVGRALPGREAEADRGRRAPRRSQPPEVCARKSMEMSVVADAAAPGFEEKAFFEYHLYTLGRPATIPNNSTKQIELFDSATRVPAKKQLVYYGADFGGYYGSADDGPRVRPGVEHEGRRLAQASGTTRPPAWACRCPRAASASRSRTRPTAASSSSARTRSTTRRRTRTCASSSARPSTSSASAGRRTSS